MPLRSNESSSRDTLNTVATSEERRRTGRYVAGGAVLAIMLLAVHHALLREASTIAGVSIPAIIMVCYIIWILYSAHRDRRKRRTWLNDLNAETSTKESFIGQLNGNGEKRRDKNKQQTAGLRGAQKVCLNWNKALRFATAMQLTEVISVPATSNEMICRNGTSKNEIRKADSSKLAYDTRASRENPAFSSKDEAA